MINLTKNGFIKGYDSEGNKVTITEANLTEANLAKIGITGFSKLSNLNEPEVEAIASTEPTLGQRVDEACAADSALQAVVIVKHASGRVVCYAAGFAEEESQQSAIGSMIIDSYRIYPPPDDTFGAHI